MTPTRSLLPAAVALVTAAGASGAEAPPPVGTVRTLPVVSVALTVGSTEKETKRVVYAPPPGWYVRSHKVEAANKTGAVTYAVGTVPAGWEWVSDEQASASTKATGSAVVATYKAWAGGKAATAADSATAGRQKNTASHHVLVVDVAAKGAGLFGGGAGVELTVHAEMVYLGPPARPAASAAPVR